MRIKNSLSVCLTYIHEIWFCFKCTIPSSQHILRFVGCNYGHVKAADESQSFCFKYYGGWIRAPTISIAKMPVNSYHQLNFWWELGWVNLKYTGYINYTYQPSECYCYRVGGLGQIQTNLINRYYCRLSTLTMEIVLFEHNTVTNSF